MRRLAIAVLGAQMTIGAALLLHSDRISGARLTYATFAMLLAGVAVGVYAAVAPMGRWESAGS